MTQPISSAPQSVTTKKVKQNQMLFALYVLVVILLLSGLYWMRNQLNAEKEKVNGMVQAQISEAEESQFLQNLEGHTLSLHDLQLLSMSQSAAIPFAKYCVAVLFTHFDCDACVTRELQRWQNFSLDNRDGRSAGVVAIIRSDRGKEMIRELRGLFSFPALMDHSDDRSIYSELNIPRGRPLVLLLDTETEKIIYAHVGHISAQNRSEKFLGKVERFLSTPEGQ